MLPELDFSFLMRTPIPGFARPSYEQDLTRLRACACTCLTCAHTSAHIHAHLHVRMHAYAHIHAHIHAHTRADPHPIPSSHSFRPRKWRFVLEDLHIGGRGLAGEEAHVANEVSIRCIGCVRTCVLVSARQRWHGDTEVYVRCACVCIWMFGCMCVFMHLCAHDQHTYTRAHTQREIQAGVRGCEEKCQHGNPEIYGDASQCHFELVFARARACVCVCVCARAFVCLGTWT